MDYTLNTKISKIEHDDLVNLFSTALYGSTYLSADYEPNADLEDCECFEDKLARTLLNGRKINVIDYYAEGDVYGDCDYIIDDEDNVVYKITLDDIIKGLENASNGTFNPSSEREEFIKREKKWAKKCFQQLVEESCEFDLISADCLMQIILFNEVIYG